MVMGLEVYSCMMSGGSGGVGSRESGDGGWRVGEMGDGRVCGTW
jgi:hypothetical protein